MKGRASAISRRLERVFMLAETFERSVFGGARSQHRFAYALHGCQLLFCWKITRSFPVFFWKIASEIPKRRFGNTGKVSKIVLEHLTSVSNFFPAKKSVRRNAFS